VGGCAKGQGTEVLMEKKRRGLEMNGVQRGGGT